MPADEAARRRVDAADLERADLEAPEELLSDREDPLALVFEPELLDAPLLLCPPRAPDSLLAIPDSLFQFGEIPLQPTYLAQQIGAITRCAGSSGPRAAVLRSQPKPEAMTNCRV